MILTARGAALCGAGVALLVVGLLREDGVLSALGLAGLLLLGGAVLVGKWNLQGLEGDLDLPERVFADDLFRGSFRLRQKGRDRFSVQARVRLAEKGKIETRAGWIPADGGSFSVLDGRFPRRGVFDRHSYFLLSGFPMGLWEQRLTGLVRRRVIVFPKAVVPREFFESGSFESAWEGSGGLTGLQPGDFHGLRSYRAGDPARLIHWGASARSLARGRRPLIRENEPPAFRPQRVTVIFHSWGANRTILHGENFERALSLLCGTLRHLRGLRVTVSLRADFLKWQELAVSGKGAWRGVLESLAGAKREAGTEEHEVRQIISEVPSEDGLILISDLPTEDWEILMRRREALAIDLSQAGKSKRPRASKARNVF